MANSVLMHYICSRSAKFSLKKILKIRILVKKYQYYAGNNLNKSVCFKHTDKVKKKNLFNIN